jgi:hypothetical protein
MRFGVAAAVLALAVSGCVDQSDEATTTTEPIAVATTVVSVPPPLDMLFGFFPFPNGTEFTDVVDHFADLSNHGDAVLAQPEVPWEDFEFGIPQYDTPAMENVANITLLAGQNDIEPIYIVDPLNGLDRTSFIGLPDDWTPSFEDPRVRTAFTGFATWIAARFQPRYMGLSSEINTYLLAHPAETAAYLDLYRTTRAAIKTESPDTSVFVTFQWEVVYGLASGALAAEPEWDQIEIFEPDLDLWVISSYPFIAFESGAEIPSNYYSPLVERTAKPLAVAEGGYISRPTGGFPGDTQSQVDHLNSVYDQIGQRLVFWINLVLDDFDPVAIADPMREQGRSESDIEGLGIFSSIGLREFDGTPKPALAVWLGFRAAEPGQ